VLDGIGFCVLRQIPAINYNLTAELIKGAENRLTWASISVSVEVCAQYHSFAPSRAAESIQRTYFQVISHYKLVLSLKFTATAGNQALGTFFFGMCHHLTTKYFSCTAIRALQSDIQTPLITSDGKVLLVCADRQHCLAAMSFVGAIDLQVSSLPASWLHEDVGEIHAATVRAGLILL
jgi:hypothetical protein